MRKLLYKIEKLTEGIVLNLHGYMLTVKYDTMLIIVNIRRILESPGALIYFHRDNSMILSCRMIYPSCIAFIFHT